MRILCCMLFHRITYAVTLKGHMLSSCGSWSCTPRSTLCCLEKHRHWRDPIKPSTQGACFSSITSDVMGVQGDCPKQVCRGWRYSHLWELSAMPRSTACCLRKRRYWRDPVQPSTQKACSSAGAMMTSMRLTLPAAVRKLPKMWSCL